jgi:hypothetical protein
MKTTKFGLTALLVLSLIFSTYNPPQADAQVAGGLLIIGCLVIGSCIIIKAMHKPGPLIDRVLVLETNLRDGNGWTGVVTNYHATLYSTNPTSIFAVQMRAVNNEVATFRVVDITDWWRQNHPLLAPPETRVILSEGETVTCDSSTADYLASLGYIRYEQGHVQEYDPAP